MYKYSIEVGHLLAKDNVGVLQEQALKLKQELKLSGYNCFMIDDYNFQENNYNVNELYELYDKYNEKINFIIYEKQLVELAEKIIPCIKEYLLYEQDNIYLITESQNYIDLYVNGKYSCAFLTSLWYLIRLNKLDWDLPLVEGIVNILPNQFESSEKKVQKILAKIYPEELLKIQWYFY